MGEVDGGQILIRMEKLDEKEVNPKILEQYKQKLKQYQSLFDSDEETNQTRPGGGDQLRIQNQPPLNKVQSHQQNDKAPNSKLSHHDLQPRQSSSANYKDLNDRKRESLDERRREDFQEHPELLSLEQNTEKANQHSNTHFDRRELVKREFQYQGEKNQIQQSYGKNALQPRFFRREDTDSTEGGRRFGQYQRNQSSYNDTERTFRYQGQNFEGFQSYRGRGRGYQRGERYQDRGIRGGRFNDSRQGDFRNHDSQSYHSRAEERTKNKLDTDENFNKKRHSPGSQIEQQKLHQSASSSQSPKRRDTKMHSENRDTSQKKIPTHEATIQRRIPDEEKSSLDTLKNQTQKQNSNSAFDRIVRHHQKASFDKEDLDYIKSICKRAQNLRQIRDQQDRDDRRHQKKQEDLKSQVQSLPILGNQKSVGGTQKSIEQRIYEAKKIAEYFYLLNETNWNKFDDVFYVINRRWFDRWKDYISYDYIVKFLVELGKKEVDLSINKILANNSSPGEISNSILLLDKKDFLQIRLSEGGGTVNERAQQYLNSPLKQNIVIERDVFLVSEGIWKFLQARYKGEEIKRYAVYRNPAGLIDRSPYLPMVQVCLILRDEAIRFPKALIMPRKAQILHIKWQIKEIFTWLKEYLDDEIRLWRLKPEFKDLDFVEQFNQSLVTKTLPKRMIFPGFSLEKSLNFYIEEYSTFDRHRETLFIEVRKIKSHWLFDLDFKDNAQFDEGAFNTAGHLLIYSGGTQHQESWQTDYSTYYKFHNNSSREYFDTSYNEGDLYKPFKLQLPWRQDMVLKSGKKAKQGKVSKQKHKDQDLMADEGGHISEISDEETKKRLDVGTVEIAERDLQEQKKCGSCSKAQDTILMVKCQECNVIFYCSDQCKERDKRFHSIDCQKYQNDPTAAKTASLSQSVILQRDSDQLADNEQNPELMAKPKSQDSTFKMVSDYSDDSDNEGLSLDTFKSFKSDNQNLDSGMIIAIEKGKLSERRDTKAQAKFSKNPAPDNTDLILNFDTHEEFKNIAVSAQSRKRSDLSSICSEPEGPASKRRRLEEHSAIQLAKVDSVHLAAPLRLSSALETPFKFETIRDKPYTKPRLVQTSKDSVKDTKLASLAVILSQLSELKEHLTIEQGPLNAILLRILNDLYDQANKDTYSLPVDKLQRLLDLEQPLHLLYRQFIQKLGLQNQQIQAMFTQKVKLTQVCLNCNQKRQNEREEQWLELSNQTDEQLSKQSVKLKIIYIYEYDQVKKYDISIKPGEYSFIEVMQKIKEKVQIDRQGVRLCKRAFLLVDLVNDNTMISQMFTNEQMKFNFKDGQSLTTFAYEIARNHKEKTKRYQFIHMAMPPDSTGKINYHSFPRLIIYKEADPLRNIAFKIFKGLRSTVQNAIPVVDQSLSMMNENDAFNFAFGRGVQNEIFQMVLVLKDGTRWKLDPHEKRKLNSIVDMEQIFLFEAIFPQEANFDVYKASLQREMASSAESEVMAGLKDIHQCMRKYLRQCLVGGDTLGEPCKDCKELRGAQLTTELMKLGSILTIMLSKVDKSQVVDVPVRLQLDRYMSKSSGYYQQGNDYELVGVIGTSLPRKEVSPVKSEISDVTKLVKSESTEIKAKVKSEIEETKNGSVTQAEAAKYTLLYNSREKVGYRYTFGEEPRLETVEIKDMDETGEAVINHPDIEFVVYRKVKRDSHSFSRP